jgi:hypothetical protein
MAPVRALLRVSSVGSDDVRALEPETVSYRAHSPGGVALASSAGSDRALLAWAALDGAEPQVFVTLLDKSGKRVSQRMLSHGKGAVEQVSAAALPKGGYAVAWLNQQAGMRHSFVATLRANLAPAAPEQALDTGPNLIDELRLFGDGDNLWLVRSEQTEDAQQRLLLSALDARTGKERGVPELVRQSDAGDIGSPVLERTPSGSVLLWVEHGRAGEAPGSLRLALLDPSGKPRGATLSLAIELGSPRLVRALCDPGGCRGVIAVREAGSERLDGFLWESGQAAIVHRLGFRDTGLREGSDPLGLTPQGLWYATRRQDRGLLRRLSIDW